MHRQPDDLVLMATVEHHLPVATLFNLICASGTKIVGAPLFLTYLCMSGALVCLVVCA